MPDNTPCYSWRERTFQINAASAKEAADLALERGCDFHFSKGSDDLQAEEDRVLAEKEQARLLEDAPDEHNPGGYRVSVARWGILSDGGSEVDSEYILTQVGSREPHFSQADIMSRSDAYISQRVLEKMEQEIPDADDAQSPRTRCPKQPGRL